MLQINMKSMWQGQRFGVHGAGAHELSRLAALAEGWVERHNEKNPSSAVFVGDRRLEDSSCEKSFNVSFFI